MSPIRCACGRVLRDVNRRRRCGVCRRNGRTRRRGTRTPLRPYGFQKPQEPRTEAAPTVSPRKDGIGPDIGEYGEAELISSLLEHGQVIETVEDPCPY